MSERDAETTKNKPPLAGGQLLACAPERVVDMRHDFQGVMAKRYTDTIEALTGRKVLAFLSQAHVEPDITMEIFFTDKPIEGFGAVEIIEPE
jgi:hypothetical protein